MIKKLPKIIAYLFLVILSPLILVAIICATVFVVFFLMGETPSTALTFLITKFNDLYPLLPYVTGIPALLVVVAIIIRYSTRNKKKNFW